LRTCLYTLSIIRLGVTHRRLKDHLHRPRRRLFCNKDLTTLSTTQHNNTTSLAKGQSTPSTYNEDSSSSTTLHPSATDLSTPSTSTTQRQQRTTYTVNLRRGLIHIVDSTILHPSLKTCLYRPRRRLNDSKGPPTPSTYDEDSSTSSTQRYYTHH